MNRADRLDPAINNNKSGVDMKKTLTALGVASAIAGLSLPLGAHALEFTGYMRIGLGESVNS